MCTYLKKKTIGHFYSNKLFLDIKLIHCCIVLSIQPVNNKENCTGHLKNILFHHHCKGGELFVRFLASFKMSFGSTEITLKLLTLFVLGTNSCNICKR